MRFVYDKSPLADLLFRHPSEILCCESLHASLKNFSRKGQVYFSSQGLIIGLLVTGRAIKI